MININAHERFSGFKRRRDEAVGTNNSFNIGTNSFNNGVPKIMRSGFGQGIEDTETRLKLLLERQECQNREFERMLAEFKNILVEIKSERTKIESLQQNSEQTQKQNSEHCTNMSEKKFDYYA